MDEIRKRVRRWLRSAAAKPGEAGSTTIAG
jgi:hypothetical protein